MTILVPGQVGFHCLWDSLGHISSPGLSVLIGRISGLHDKISRTITLTYFAIKK